MATSAANVPVPLDESLHLRPMQMLVEQATGFAARITAIRGSKRADAKSIFDVMMLATERGPLRIEADGREAVEAVDALARLMKRELKKG